MIYYVFLSLFFLPLLYHIILFILVSIYLVLAFISMCTAADYYSHYQYYHSLSSLSSYHASIPSSSCFIINSIIHVSFTHIILLINRCGCHSHQSLLLSTSIFYFFFRLSAIFDLSILYSILKANMCNVAYILGEI